MNMFLKELKVGVCREYREFMPFCYRADQKVGIGALDPFGAKNVEKLGGPLIIRKRQFQIRKHAQVVPERLELILGPYAGQYLLADRSYHLNPELFGQFPQLQNIRVIVRFLTAATQRQRPHAGIHQNLHVFFRWAL